MRLFGPGSADHTWQEAASALFAREGTFDAPSRLGPTTELVHTCLHLDQPTARWVASRTPALNVAFALAEVVWIVNGRQDVDFLSHWNRSFPAFVGDAAVAAGAYGARLRSRFGLDQLEAAYRSLIANGMTRQVVLNLWSPVDDMPISAGAPRSGDIPCNIAASLRLIDGRLEWMQFCRSSDLFLGLPHNFVQFTYLQEIVAGWLGVGVGNYVSCISSLHVYEHDRASYGWNQHLEVIPETLSVSLPKKEADAAWSELSRRAQGLVELPLTSAYTRAHFCLGSLPPGQEAIWKILLAEDFRRRGWLDESRRAITECSDPGLSALWQRWEERIGVQ